MLVKKSSLDCAVEEYCHVVTRGNQENKLQFSRSWDTINGRWTVWLNDNISQGCLTFSADKGTEEMPVIRTVQFCVQLLTATDKKKAWKSMGSPHCFSLKASMFPPTLVLFLTLRGQTVRIPCQTGETRHHHDSRICAYSRSSWNLRLAINFIREKSIIIFTLLLEL